MYWLLGMLVFLSLATIGVKEATLVIFIGCVCGFLIWSFGLRCKLVAWIGVVFGLLIGLVGIITTNYWLTFLLVGLALGSSGVVAIARNPTSYIILRKEVMKL
jgi:hypothetical protein